MVQTQIAPLQALRAIPEGVLATAIRAADEKRAQSLTNVDDQVAQGLAAYIRRQFETFQRHRNDAAAGWSNRLLDAFRAFNGQYDPSTLADIQKFGGSQVYARITAAKCRGATALLRDVYLSPDRPWGLEPPSDPEIPAEILAAIQQLVSSEVRAMQQAGQKLDPGQVRDRVNSLKDHARDAAKRQAEKRCKLAEDKIDEMLVEGGFYRALAELLVDLPLFPFACLKGPFVKIVPAVKWSNGVAVTLQKPKLMWARISPFDIWWSPGVSAIEDAQIIERTRLTRADLNDLLDLPGYNKDAIRSVLDDYGRGGLSENWDWTDSERAILESRESPVLNQTGLLDCLEFTGNVQGRILRDEGMTNKQIPDELRDYMVQAWVIGRYTIKVQLSPSPRKRHPYYVTSFEKVPGTVIGNAIPDLVMDMQNVANATLRALVNNLSISSGPQVVINDDLVQPGENSEDMYPWKRWHVRRDPVTNGNGAQKPIDFFQPQSNAQELLAVFQAINTLADDVSAIPKYVSGNGPGGGAGRTASGLAMLMGNASKLLQTVAANVDRDVMDPALTGLLDMLMLTDSEGDLQGDENVRVMGVDVAIQRETQRSRQLEFLQATANPIDSQIVGPKGRAAILRSISQSLGLPGEEIVPSDDELEAKQQAAAQEAAAMSQAGAAAQGNKQASPVTKDMGPRTRIAGGAG